MLQMQSLCNGLTLRGTYMQQHHLVYLCAFTLIPFFKLQLTLRERERERVCRVFSLGVEAWMNILLVTISGRDRLSKCTTCSPFMFRICSKMLYFMTVMLRFHLNNSQH